MSETPSSTTPSGSTSASNPAGNSALGFSNIRGFSKHDVGQFKISGDLCGWRNKETKAVTQFNKGQIVKAEWLRTSAKEAQLKLVLSENHRIIRFDGFKDSDYDSINRYMKQYWKMDMERIVASTRGWHWGEYAWDDKNFNFFIDGKRSFDIHAPAISQITTPSKTDISVEFNQEDSTDTKDDQLVEIRFYMPPAKEETNVDAQEVLKEDLVLKSGVGAAGGDSICQLSEVYVLVPRGRYDMHLLKTALKLHGRSTKFNIPYKSIIKMFLLPQPNAPHVFFVLNLDTALRQGQTTYKNVVVQFDDTKVTELKLNLPDDELKLLQEKQPEVEREMSGSQYEVVTHIVKALTGKQVLTPPGDFQSSQSNPCIRCSHKAQDGHLYPLNKSFIFIPKPVLIIKYDEIVRIEFSRTSGSQTRFFEFRVELKSGNVDFTSIDRREYQVLVDFFKQKGVKILNMEQEAAEKEKAALLDLAEEDESDDDDFEADEESEEESSSDEDEEGEDAETNESPRKRSAR